VVAAAAVALEAVAFAAAVAAAAAAAAFCALTPPFAFAPAFIQGLDHIAFHVIFIGCDPHKLTSVPGALDDVASNVNAGPIFFTAAAAVAAAAAAAAAFTAAAAFPAPAPAFCCCIDGRVNNACHVTRYLMT